MKQARDLSREKLVSIVDDIQQILYLSANAQGMTWDPDQEWDCETIEYVAGVLEDAGLKPEREMPREPAGEDRRLAALVEQLVASDEANHNVQFAVDDLVFDEIGTGKHASNINNGGIANQVQALVERIGLEDTIQALQAVVDDFAQPSDAIVVEPPVVGDRQVTTDLVDKVSLQKHPTKYVSSVTVIDPDTNAPVELEIRKELHTQAMIGIDASFLEQDVGPVYDPYNPHTELEIPDDE